MGIDVSENFDGRNQACMINEPVQDLDLGKCRLPMHAVKHMGGWIICGSLLVMR